MIIKKIHSKNIALQLIRKGHDFIYCEPHATKERLTVFFFEETAQLKRDLNEIFS
ncbi:hypothetical protein [Priestia megaterium]|uniref:hypothetical protein n=1 Tax=Priestia megaterium TaxID=1404 RepID=UPI00196AB3B3|nr:hypothetical protein [Priestia megaterium]QSF38456.1 hypothetical protein ICR96_23920 [Priestia megaterium]